MIEIKSKASPRPIFKAAPGCEAMEGRRLLNGAGWGAGLAAGKLPPADHHAFAGGAKNSAPPSLSASARAALTQLQADQKALQAEVQADATVQADEAAVQADQTKIDAALGVSAGRSKWTAPAGKGFHPATDPGLVDGFPGHRPGGPLGLRDGSGNGNDSTPALPADLTARLNAAGISTTAITADMTRLQADIKAVDPTLAASVQADETALQAVLPAPAMHFDHIVKATSTNPGTTTTN